MSAGAVAAIVGFCVLFGLVIWFGMRQSGELDGWLQDRVSEDGWTAGSVEQMHSQAGWLWLANLAATRDVMVQSLVEKPASNESAFTLITRGFGGRAGAARHIGVGMTTALPSVITPPLLASPVPAEGFGTFFGLLVGLDLPQAEVTNPDLGDQWSFWSREPVAARDLLAQAPDLRSALDALSDQLWTATRFQYFLLELNGARATLIGGPKMVGRQPFVELGQLAHTLVSRLR
jgi:hypothetical protein